MSEGQKGIADRGCLPDSIPSLINAATLDSSTGRGAKADGRYLAGALLFSCALSTADRAQTLPAYSLLPSRWGFGLA